MIQFLARRLVLLLFLLALVNFAGFAFAHITFQLQQSTTIFGSGQEGITPVWPEYASYARGLLAGDLGAMPATVNQTIGEALQRALRASLGLLALAFGLSLGVGLPLGLLAVRAEPPGVAPWLTAVATLGLAMPSFYVGALLVGGVLLLAARGAGTLFPVGGFGWDAHLVLPVIALAVRPTMQVARITAALLAGEMDRRYVVAARSFGHTWRAIRWDKALRNILAPVVMTIAGSFRLLMSELVLVEWLFSWPGIGRLLVMTLVPPRMSGPGGLHGMTAYLLNPPLVAALLVVFALFFLLADLLASSLARVLDPRLRALDAETHPGG